MAIVFVVRAICSDVYCCCWLAGFLRESRLRLAKCVRLTRVLFLIDRGSISRGVKQLFTGASVLRASMAALFEHSNFFRTVDSILVVGIRLDCDLSWVLVCKLSTKLIQARIGLNAFLRPG